MSFVEGKRVKRLERVTPTIGATTNDLPQRGTRNRAEGAFLSTFFVDLSCVAAACRKAVVYKVDDVVSMIPGECLFKLNLFKTAMHLLALPLLLGAAQALLVPPPPGPYAVAVKNIELIDPSRIDPLAPEPNTKRRFMASAYLPVDDRCDCLTQVVPYMPALTASIFGKLGESLGVPQGFLERFELEFCDISSVKSDVNAKKKDFPVAVFSPGLGGTRLIYGALARSLASLGYIVITLDHTYETGVVEFPDGSVAYAGAYATYIGSGNATVILEGLLKVI